LVMFVYRREFINGRQLFVPSQTGKRTDDRGAYRIAPLHAGDYLISAGMKYLEQEFIVPPPDPDPAAPDPLSVTDVFPDAGSLPDHRVLVSLTGSLLPIENLDGSMLTYPTTFFPGTTTAASALVVHLDANELREGVSFQLQPVVTVRISGHVID